MKIQISHIRKSYRHKEVLKDITFSASSGTAIGILGENGCGKSTLLGILAGALKADEGEFLLDGSSLPETGDLLRRPVLRSHVVGYVPQTTPLLEELSVKDNLRLWYPGGSDTLSQELKSGVLRDLQVQDFLNRQVLKLSGGMKKRVSIGCAVANHPQILILDEPGAALDLVCKEVILDYLQGFCRQGGIVIMASHEIQEIVSCSRTFILKDGTLKPYTFDELQMKKVLRTYPAMLLMTFLLALILGAMLYLQSSKAANTMTGDEDSKAAIGIVGSDSSPYLKMGIRLLQNLDPSKVAVRFQQLSHEDALASLKKGKLSAVIIIPEGLTDKLLSGDVSSKMTLILPDSGASLEPLLIRELSACVSVIIGQMESASYALADFYTASGVTSAEDISDAQTDLLYRSIRKLLSRSQMFTLRRMKTAGTLTIDVPVTIYAPIIPSRSCFISGDFMHSVRLYLNICPWFCSCCC